MNPSLIWRCRKCGQLTEVRGDADGKPIDDPPIHCYSLLGCDGVPVQVRFVEVEEDDTVSGM